jgi:hypothetical protein
MAAPDAPPAIVPAIPLQQWMGFALFGSLIVFAIFVLLVLVRVWGLRMQTRARATGNLDLEHLRAQHDAGQLSPEEYAAVRRQLVGGAGAAAKPPGAQMQGAARETAAAAGPPPAPDDDASEKPIEPPGSDHGDRDKEPSA